MKSPRNRQTFNPLGCFLALAGLPIAALAVEAPVNLGATATFAVLAGSAVNNTPVFGTTITGNVGVNPGAAVIGFPPGVVIGTIHAGDLVAAQAKADLIVAYNDAAGRTSPDRVALPGNLGGLTLTPGLYRSASLVEISSGDLTLDAQGDPTAVFIFQVAGTLSAAPCRQVILTGGAQTAHVFWQVAGSATIGSAFVFHGNVLAAGSITIETDATLIGRALSRDGAVALASNTIVATASPRFPAWYRNPNAHEPLPQTSIRFEPKDPAGSKASRLRGDPVSGSAVWEKRSARSSRRGPGSRQERSFQ